jgi:hypothetical protein
MAAQIQQVENLRTEAKEGPTRGEMGQLLLLAEAIARNEAGGSHSDPKELKAYMVEQGFVGTPTAKMVADELFKSDPNNKMAKDLLIWAKMVAARDKATRKALNRR